MTDNDQTEIHMDINQEASCLQCNRVIQPGEERRSTEQGIFCIPCYEMLKSQVLDSLSQQGDGINWVNAVVGALGGGLLGALAWWGFTVLTKISFGLVAVVIGVFVGKGILIMTGQRRSRNLQIMSVIVSAVA